jgi:hypothetical protein
MQFTGCSTNGCDLDHLCRVRHCIYPGHMEPVTRSINVQRGLIGKLTRDDVLDIRRKLLAMADEYGITPGTLAQYARRDCKSWPDAWPDKE